MATVDLSVIIVNWNTAELTIAAAGSSRHALESLAGEIVIVDNGSEPDDLGRLAAALPGAELIRNATNAGFGAAVNRGLRESRGRYVMLLNSDATMARDTAAHLVAYLEAHPGVAAAGPRILYDDGRVQLSARGFPNLWSAFFGRQALLTQWFPQNPLSRSNLPTLGNEPDGAIGVDWVSGACMVIRRSALVEAGAFDEDFFMYWEDADLCWRLRERGWTVIYDPRVDVTHTVGASSNAAIVRCTIDFHKSAYRFYRKHLTRRRAHPMNAVAIAGLTARAALLVCLRTASRRLSRVLVKRKRRPQSAEVR